MDGFEISVSKEESNKTTDNKESREEIQQQA